MGLISGAVRTVGQVLDRPAHLPMELTKSSAAMGAAGTTLVAGVSGAIAQSMASLEPKGPAKMLTMFLGDTVQKAAARDREIAQRNIDVFWKPVSEGAIALSHGLLGWTQIPAVKEAGHKPSAEILGAALDTPLFSKIPPPAQEAAPAAAPPQGAAPANPKVTGGDQGGTPPAAPTDGTPPQGGTPPAPHAAAAPEQAPAAQAPPAAPAPSAPQPPADAPAPQEQAAPAAAPA